MQVSDGPQQGTSPRRRMNRRGKLLQLSDQSSVLDRFRHIRLESGRQRLLAVFSSGMCRDGHSLGTRPIGPLWARTRRSSAYPSSSGIAMSVTRTDRCHSCNMLRADRAEEAVSTSAPRLVRTAWRSSRSSG